MRYFLYARKSQEDKKRQVASIADQIKECEKLELDGSIVDVLTEERSASYPGRPVFNQMMDRIETGEADGIVCWMLDRLSRNPDDGGRVQGFLQRETIKNITTAVDGRYTPDDNALVISVLFGKATQYSRDLSLNVRRGKKTKAERGEYHGVKKYGIIYHPALREAGIVVKQGWVEIHPDESKVVKKIYKLAAEGKSVRDIARWLDDNEVIKPDPNRLRAGKKRLGDTEWPLETIRKILWDDTYTGVAWFGKTRSVGGNKKERRDPSEWIPVDLGFSIVSKDLAERARKNLAIKRKAKKGKRFYLLKGIAECGYCGYKITGTPSGNNNSYYRCGARHLSYTNPSKCPMRMIKAVDLDRAVMRKIETLINDPDAIRKQAMTKVQQRQTKEDSQRERARLKLKMSRLVDLYSEGDIDKELFRTKKTAIEQQILEVVDDDVFEPDKLEVETWAKAMKEKLSNADDNDKRQIVISLADKIVVKNDKVRVVLSGGQSLTDGGGDIDPSAT